jgi:hypothetical protein
LSFSPGSVLVKLAVNYVLPALVEEVVKYATRQVLWSAFSPAVAIPEPPGRLRPEYPAQLRLIVPNEDLVILSDTPGRLRVHVAVLRDNSARATALATAMAGLNGVKSSDPNILTGNVLVQYEPREVTPLQILAAIENRQRATRFRTLSTAKIRLLPPLVPVGV